MTRTVLGGAAPFFLHPLAEEPDEVIDPEAIEERRRSASAHAQPREVVPSIAVQS